MEVGAGADEEQDNEQKGLEFENAEHCMGVQYNRLVGLVSCVMLIVSYRRLDHSSMW